VQIEIEHIRMLRATFETEHVVDARRAVDERFEFGDPRDT
jgi:hypothetical protein